MNNIKKDILSVETFKEERPDLSIHTDDTIEAAINSTATLLNGETGGLIEQCWYEQDTKSPFFRNDYEKDQIKEAFIVQTQYTVNIGNDFTQGGGSTSIGNVSNAWSRPEQRDVIAPGVLKLLSNGRVYNLQVIGLNNENVRDKQYIDPYFQEPITRDIGDKRYVMEEQPNADAGNIAYIGDNKMVSWGKPEDLNITTYKTNMIKDWKTTDYLPIEKISDIAFFGNDANGPHSAMTRQEIEGKIDGIVAGETQWGKITGTLENQTDLSNALTTINENVDSKQNKLVAGINITLTENEDNTTTIAGSGDIAAKWGNITGTISNQTDLFKNLLKAGDNITIDANTTLNEIIISSTGGGSATGSVKVWDATVTYNEGDLVAFVIPEDASSTNEKAAYPYQGYLVFAISTQDNNIGHGYEEYDWWRYTKVAYPNITTKSFVDRDGLEIDIKKGETIIRLRDNYEYPLFFNPGQTMANSYLEGDVVYFYKPGVNLNGFYKALKATQFTPINERESWEKIYPEIDNTPLKKNYINTMTLSGPKKLPMQPLNTGDILLENNVIDDPYLKGRTTIAWASTIDNNSTEVPREGTGQVSDNWVRLNAQVVGGKNLIMGDVNGWDGIPQYSVAFDMQELDRGDSRSHDKQLKFWFNNGPTVTGTNWKYVETKERIYPEINPTITDNISQMSNQLKVIDSDITKIKSDLEVVTTNTNANTVDLTNFKPHMEGYVYGRVIVGKDGINNPLMSYKGYVFTDFILLNVGGWYTTGNVMKQFSTSNIYFQYNGQLGRSELKVFNLENYSEGFINVEYLVKADKQ